MTARFILSVGNEARSPNRAFFDYDQREEISLADAVFWASSLSFEVTLYVYDLGEGIKSAGKLSDLLPK
jgi:hypothetical protein